MEMSALSLLGALNCVAVGFCFGLGWWIINRIMTRVFG